MAHHDLAQKIVHHLERILVARLPALCDLALPKRVAVVASRAVGLDSEDDELAEEIVDDRADRRARHAPGMRAREVKARLGDGGHRGALVGWLRHLLALVEHDTPPVHAQDRPERPLPRDLGAQHLVRRQHDVSIEERREVLVALLACGVGVMDVDLEPLAGDFEDLSLPLIEQHNGADDKRRLGRRWRRRTSRPADHGTAGSRRTSGVRVGQNERAHFDRLAEAHLLAEEAARDHRQLVVAQLARHWVVPVRMIIAATLVRRVLAPEECVEPARLRLAVEHPLQALPLVGVERELQPRRVDHLVVARALHSPHQTGERERVRRRLRRRCGRGARRARRTARRKRHLAPDGRRARRLDEGRHRRHLVEEQPDVVEARRARVPRRDAQVEDAGHQPHVELHLDRRLVALQTPRERRLPLHVHERLALPVARRRGVARVGEPPDGAEQLVAMRAVGQRDLVREHVEQLHRGGLAARADEHGRVGRAAVGR